MIKFTFLLNMLLISMASYSNSEFFKLYKNQDFRPNPNCDRFTKLEFITSNNGVKIKLSEHINGVCLQYVEPNKRSYELQFFKKECGSNYYNSRDEKVQLIDHRGRICRDKKPADIIVVENDQALFTSKYSLWRNTNFIPTDLFSRHSPFHDYS